MISDTAAKENGIGNSSARAAHYRFEPVACSGAKLSGPAASGERLAKELRLCQPVASVFHIGRGIDEETRLFHLGRGDYSRWIRESIKNKEFAEVVRQLEERSDLHPKDSRNRICDAIEVRYSLST